MDLKLRELLGEVRLGDSAAETLDRLVSSVAEAIGSIPDQEIGADAGLGFVRDLRVAYNKVGFTFKRPEAVEVSGSHSVGCVAKPDVNVDLLVRMPKVEQKKRNFFCG